MEFSFLESLHQFVLSVDIVDDKTKEDVLSKIHDYLQKLDIGEYMFLVDANVENTSGLVTELTPNNEFKWTGRIKDSNDKYCGQIPYAYDTRSSLWVVGADKEPLVNAETYIDLWNPDQYNSIPTYSPKAQVKENMRTAIYIPLLSENKIVGIANFESGNYMTWNSALSEELLLITEILGKIYQLYKAYSIQKGCTGKALKKIVVPKEPRIPKPIPQVFFAFSVEADKNVTKIIKSIINEKYKNKLHLISWDVDHTSGNIIQILIKNIVQCEYGIFYFSEQITNEPDVKYHDNSNVLFEAGMFFILSIRPDNVPKSWIPIREAQDLHIDKEPFDFRNERKLIVKRNKGQFDKKDFEEQLTKRIDSLLEI